MQQLESILIVDDEESICRLCHATLASTFSNVQWTTNAHKAIQLLKEKPFELLITDIKMPTMSGIELMHQAHTILPTLPVIVMTAYATVETAVQAVKEGAGDFIHKPFHIEEFMLTIQNVLEKQKLNKENNRLHAVVNLLKTSEKISTIHDSQTLYSVVLHAAVKETGAASGKIYHIDPGSHSQIVDCELKKETGFSNLSYGASNEIGVYHEVEIPLKSKDRDKGVLALHSENGLGFTQADIDVAGIIARQAAVAIENSELVQDIEDLFLNAIKSLAFTLDEKDPYTHGHSQRVSTFAVEIGERMWLSKEEISVLSLAGSLHDIGKIGIPDGILQKPGKLTKEEFDIIKTHPEKGAKILRPINRLEKVIEAVHTHHEWYNGNGYPRKLKGDEIPLIGAIICVADAIDTIISERPYQQKRTLSEAYDILREQSGKQFHPEVVKAVLKKPLI